jgi:transposase-like protein
MRYSFRDTVTEENARPPTACPACKSTDLTTTSKPVTPASYWRCLTCGEIWNAERLEAGSRYWPHRR